MEYAGPEIAKSGFFWKGKSRRPALCRRIWSRVAGSPEFYYSLGLSRNFLRE
jgi:hypothetical protein